MQVYTGTRPVFFVVFAETLDKSQPVTRLTGVNQQLARFAYSLAAQHLAPGGLQNTICTAYLVALSGLGCAQFDKTFKGHPL